MIQIGNYMDDGADAQSQCVLALLRPFHIASSWNDLTKSYDAVLQVARWDNGRERGYIVSMRTSPTDLRQLNIAFFEHRNSCKICAVKWEQISDNPLNIATANFGDIYKDKWDISYSVDYGKFLKMVKWIEDQFTEFYESHTFKD